MKMEAAERTVRLACRLLGFRRILRCSSGTERGRHYSGMFTRALLGSSGMRAVFLGAPAGLPESRVERFLAEAVTWWDANCGSGKMILFVPATWHPRINWLLPFLKIPLQCFVYSSSPPGCREIFPGNGQVSSLGEPCIIFPGSPPPGPLREMQQRFPGLDLLFRRDRWELSHLGLPVLWKKGSGTYWFDFFNPRRVRSIPGDCAEHVAKVIRLRSGKGKGRDSLYYRFAPERWMESLLIRDLSLVRPNLGSRFYCQVPSRQGRRRKILDILAADLRGRLVVLEIKVECRIEDLFQGLGYRERVARHLVNGDFQRLGYFQGMELEQEVPALGFVSPLFAFHRGMPGIWRYLKPGGEVFCTGLNSDWRNGIRPLRRFGLEPGGGYGRETPRS